ncbi:metal ABC transporter permease [Alphaproteobacteria bacterium]|nr:metal ABC transporter permease [Alphaproteobacteria bacterium]
MLDDFFIRAVVGGVGVALLAGPLGCFIVWRRLAYFGDTLSHSALLGVAMALLLDMNITLTVFIISVAVSLLLILLQRRASLSSDALLGLLAHATLAVGLVVLAFMTWVRVDLMGFLFGDILAITVRDIIIIWCGGLAVIAIVSLIWKSLLASTVSYDIAVAEGLRPDLTNFVFMVLMAGVIAISMKIVGVLLITALLIIPAATARRFSGNPEVMAVMASVLGAGSVWLGLEGSLEWDTPAGPSIVVAALAFFITSVLPFQKLRNRKLTATIQAVLRRYENSEKQTDKRTGTN